MLAVPAARRPPLTIKLLRLAYCVTVGAASAVCAAHVHMQRMLCYMLSAVG
jgi:hypothetical protein